MILGVANSINDVPVRLTDERWEKILEKHPEQFSYHDYDEILEAVERPEYILRGNGGAFIAVMPFGRRGFLHVMYREVSKDDGFIITAFLKSSFARNLVIWREQDQ